MASANSRSAASFRSGGVGEPVRLPVALAMLGSSSHRAIRPCVGSSERSVSSEGNEGSSRGGRPVEGSPPGREVHMAAAIETEGLTKRYGSAVVLDRLDLTVEQGEVFGY